MAIKTFSDNVVQNVFQFDVLRRHNISFLLIIWTWCRNLTREYKRIEPDCREGVRAQLERMKELCKERNNLYEKQNDLKRQKYKIEISLER